MKSLEKDLNFDLISKELINSNKKLTNFKFKEYFHNHS